MKTQDPEGNFVEIPLSIYNNNPFYRLLNKLILILEKDMIFGDGIGIQEKSHFFLRSLSRRVRFSKAFLTIDKTCKRFLTFLLKYHFQKHSVIVIISHPKTISKQALLNLAFISSSYQTLNSDDLDNLITSY